MDQSTQTAIVIVLTTLDATADATRLAQTLVAERLAACVNVLPAMHSVYRWQGSVESAQEQQLVIKTSGDRLDAIKARLGELHPYAVPEVVVIPVLDVTPAYRAWLFEATRA